MDEEQMREFIVSWLEDNLTDEQFRAEGYQSPLYIVAVDEDARILGYRATWSDGNGSGPGVEVIFGGEISVWEGLDVGGRTLIALDANAKPLIAVLS